MTAHDWPYILDNGAYAADVNDEEWDPDPFLRRLNELNDRMHRDPEFVVLPDVRGDAAASERQTRMWANRLAARGFDYPWAVAVQDGMTPDQACELAVDVDADVLFVGGSDPWKVSNSAALVRAAHAAGLHAHIGRPMDLTFADAVGADSVDTTSIVRNEDYARLQAFEEQTTVADFAPTE
ncbi:hypothetical protein [Halorussus amylolyticus]|uniref:hypothetical protein n=1 Tax=Halorussus amylolyticus TaxID=1126242 RepID=UPI0010515384|nr:hypothetical protein [Halorussus amylolyticus]